MSLTGYQKSEFCLKQGRKLSDICLKQGQGIGALLHLPTQGYIKYPPGVRMEILLHGLLEARNIHEPLTGLSFARVTSIICGIEIVSSGWLLTTL